MLERAGIIAMFFFVGATVAAPGAEGSPGAGGGSAAAGGLPEAHEAREAIRGWMEAEDAISRERADWAAQKATMAELLALHRKELALLDEELSKAGMSAPAHEARMAKSRKAVARLRAARRRAGETVAVAVPRMLRLAGMFPDPLRAEAREDLASLEAWRPGGDPRDALRALLGAVSKAEAFHRRVTRTREVRGGREVEVVYLGLARAYYVGGGRAGVGVPAPGGWKWTEDPGLEKPLARAIAVLDRKRPPEVVELPVKILDLGEKEGGK
jgi:hypothetical protein